MSSVFLISALLAFIQSATEFLPVSSSAHLLLVSTFGFSQHGIFSDVALHFGTLLAVLLYFEEDLRKMIFNLDKDGAERRLFKHLCIATIPIVIVVPLVGMDMISRLRLPVIVAGASIIFGLLLWLADRFPSANSDLRSMTVADALCIGLAQILSLVPGVSRSGITITCCRALGFTRRESARFAMLLSIPTIGGAVVYTFYYAWKNNELNRILTPDVALGTALSAIMGLLVIRFLMRWVRRSSFAIFAVYRVILGLFVLDYFLGTFGIIAYIEHLLP